MPEDQLRGCDLIVQVMNTDTVTDVKSEIGSVHIGCHSEGVCFEQWNSVLDNPGKSIARWYEVVK